MPIDPAARRIGISIGGNALAPISNVSPLASSQGIAEQTLLALLPLFQPQNSILLTHGNGPQVGRLFGAGNNNPLDVCVAQTQGELGYLLGRTLLNVLAQGRVPMRFSACVTLVEVDASDPAFLHPSKPIGDRLPAQAAHQAATEGYLLEQADGFRRLVPSPLPKQILELQGIRPLFIPGAVLLAGGGGGIPLIKQSLPDGTIRLTGVAAVIDKDYTTALLAEGLDLDWLIFVTAVPQVFSGFGSPAQKAIAHLDITTAKTLQRQGHFHVSSMGPKITAALAFLEQPNARHRRVLICGANNITESLAGSAGTWITP